MIINVLLGIPCFETLADIFTRLSVFESRKGSSNTFKAHKNISLYFKRRYLIIYVSHIKKYEERTEFTITYVGGQMLERGSDAREIVVLISFFTFLGPVYTR